jgi:hypothetical protein
MTLRRNEEAISAFQKYIELTPGDPDGMHAAMQDTIRQLKSK